MDIQKFSLPVSYEAEQSVLGAVLMKPDCFGEILGKLKAEDFYIEEHRDIYLTMYSLYAQNKNIDHVTVTEGLVNSGTMDAERAKQALLRIVTAVPSAANAGDYAEIVKDRAVRRTLINLCREVEESAASEADSAEHLLEIAEKKLYDL